MSSKDDKSSGEYFREVFGSKKRVGLIVNFGIY
jgi:hypothetical protein